MIKSEKNWGLKGTPWQLVLLVFFFAECTVEKTDFYKEVEFISGFPQILKPIKKDLPFKNYSFTNLETNSDTLKVIFGTLSQGTTEGHWIAIILNGKPAHFSTVSLEKVDSLNQRMKDVYIEFNENKSKISVRLLEVDSLTKKIKYSWLDDSNLSHNLVVKKVVKPIRIASRFPDIYLRTISDEQIHSSQFANKFVVINWWATWCAPCIKEIPGLNKIVENYSNNDNVKFIAITDDPKSRIEFFLEEKDFKYEMTFANSKVKTLFGNSYPVNIIINPKGNVTFFKEGAGNLTPFEIESSLKQQLKEYKWDIIPRK